MPSVRAFPWARILAVAQSSSNGSRDDIPKKDRSGSTASSRKSKGDPRALTAAERSEIVRILRQVDSQARPRRRRDRSRASRAGC